MCSFWDSSDEICSTAVRSNLYRAILSRCAERVVGRLYIVPIRQAPYDALPQAHMIRQEEHKGSGA